VVFAAAVEIAGDVTRGNADVAQEGDHGVREILADAFTADDGFVNGRVDASVAGDVFKVLEEALIEFLDEHEGIVAAGDAELLGKKNDGGGFNGKLAGSSISQ